MPSLKKNYLRGLTYHDIYFMCFFYSGCLKSWELKKKKKFTVSHYLSALLSDHALHIGYSTRYIDTYIGGEGAQKQIKAIIILPFYCSFQMNKKHSNIKQILAWCWTTTAYHDDMVLGARHKIWEKNCLTPWTSFLLTCWAGQAYRSRN